MVTTAVVAAGLALLALLVLAGPRLTARAREQSFTALAAEARLMARVMEDELARGVAPDALDPVVDAAAKDVDARVTVIDRDGRVLSDSAASGAELARLENHAGRPEVREALAGRVARSERHSATVAAELLYVAAPIRSGNAVVGVARLSRNRAEIEAAGRALWRTAAVALGLALVATGLLSLLLSASLGRSLREIMETARQFAKGNLAARIRVRRDDELGELAHIINQSADQLQERVAEVARDRGRTEAILSAMDDGVLAVDHRGRVVLANPHLTRALDLAAPIGRHYVEVVRQHDVGALIEGILRTGERREAEVELIHRRRFYTITAVPFPGAEGTPPGAVLTFNDATERRRVEDMRRDFVANASHELRTPLTSIRGFVEALEDGALEQPETARRFLGKIRAHADRMATLIEDLLELSRLEGRDGEESWSETPLAGVVDDVAGAFAETAARKEIALRRSVRGAPSVVTDPERLRRILENLVDNALKYTPQGGHVDVVATAESDGSARVEVADDGPGIGAEHVPRIFERFYRVDKARSRELGGTGLGLSIVKHLAESVGAAVSVDSEPGRGSRFTVLLPARPRAGADGETARKRPGPEEPPRADQA
jgi:two-component system phosphate regulon sensor histidine kinase PhoR